MLQNHTGKTAIYARRSPEDKANRQNQFRGNGVSDSIESQLLMLHQYADAQGFTNCAEFYDDNISGTTFQRPQFLTMLEHIQAGQINTVIIKDLSRLGRDYIESGRYQEVIFPELGTRLIAVLDNYDSATGAGMDTAVFKNVFNDYYVKDISNKTRAALRARATAGKYVSSGIYGYQKDPHDRNHLILDPETAPIVQRVFSMAASGHTFRSIARTLASEGILSPGTYKGVADSGSDWYSCAVANIIRTPEYLGQVVFGKTKKISYKSSKIIRLPEEEWIVVEGTHEPMVSKETWDLANEIANRPKKSGKYAPPHIFAGLLFCGDCKAAIVRKTGEYFVCNRYKNFARAENGCTSHRISYGLLYAAVLASVQEVTQETRRDRDALIERLSGMGNKKQQAALAAATKDRAKAEKRLAEIGELIRKAFEKNALGGLPDDLYNSLMDGYTKERATLAAQVEALTAQVAELTQDTNNAEQFVSLVEQCVDVTELDRELAHRLIDRIEVGESYKESGVRYQTIDIYFRFVGKIEK